MSEFDFESNDSNNEPINTGNGSSKNGPIKNSSGGVPLIAIIGVMAIIIVGLIVYIVMEETSKPEEVTENDVIQSEVEDIPENEMVKDAVEAYTNLNVTEKEDKTTEDVDVPVSEEKTENENSSFTGSSDWKSGEFKLNGKELKLNDSYKNLVDSGWSMDLVKMGYEGGYILNKDDKTYSTIDIENPDFEDANVRIGFINNDEEAKDVTECDFWGISVDNSYSDTPVDFELPGGIKYGSTIEEIEAAYGKPEEDDIYRSDSLGYTNYSYSYDFSIYLDLTVYDDKGLVDFDYKIY